MLADPQTVTLNAVANVMPAISRSGLVSEYSLADGTLKLKVSHTVGKRVRTQVSLNTSKITADPLSDANIAVGANVYLVIDRPLAGFTVDELTYVVAGLSAWLTASTNANTKKVLGLES